MRRAVSVDRIDWTNRVAEMGYSLGAEHQGRGIVTACMRVLIHYTFDELKLNRVELRCAAENLKSRAVAERLGFTREGELRESWLIHGRFVGQIVYACSLQNGVRGKAEPESR
ncbi:MAG TPA: GNAT family protein, partial [Pyrinomonadaceae bacterium]|nr:GNAT family protein [Pyrinomonadaceae bacterium]